MKRIWSKIEKILIAYQKDLAITWHLENRLPFFSITKDNNLNVLEIKKDYHNYEKVNLEELFNTIDAQSEHSYRCNFRVDINDKKRKSILWMISNAELPLEDKKKLINLFFREEQLFRLAPFLRVIRKIKNKDNLSERKLIVLHLLSIVKPKESYCGGTLKSIVDELNFYEYNKTDFPILENLFSLYKKEIKGNKNSNERAVFINFLREKIDANNWSYFKHLYEKEDIKSNSYDIVENKNAKMHLIFNIHFIKEKYKFLSLENDANIVLEKISKNLLHFHYKFNIEELNVLQNNDEKFVVYLVSKNDQEVNKSLVVNVFYKFIEEYKKSVDLFENKLLMEKLIDCELLCFVLNDKNLKNRNIIKI